MNSTDPGNLTDLIRDCAIDLWENGPTSSGAGFVTAFNPQSRFGHLVNEDQRQYCVDRWLA